MKQTSSGPERKQPLYGLEQEQTSCSSEVHQTSSDMDETSRVPRVPCHCAAPGMLKQFTCESCQVSVCRKCLPSHHLNCDQNSSTESHEQRKNELNATAEKMTNGFTNMIAIMKNIAERVYSKVSKVNIMIENLDIYKERLKNYLVRLTEMQERVGYNLLQVANQKKKLSESSNAVNKCVEVNSALEALEPLKIPACPITNLEYIVDVHYDVRNDPDLGSFNTSFCQLLRAQIKFREFASFERVENSWKNLLEHDGFWDVCSSTEADQAIKLFTETATRPREVTVTIDEKWKNLNLFLSVLANHACVVRLDFFNLTSFPNETSSAVIADVLRQIRDTTSRYQLRSFFGQLNLVTAKLLMEIAPDKEIGLQLIIRGADEIEALKCLTSSCYTYISLYISSTAEPASLSALPVSSYCQLTIPEVTDNKLPWLCEALTKLDCRGEHVEEMMLSPSRLTEWGLKQLLEFLEQAGISDKTINVLTAALDQAAKNRIIQSYQERIGSSINIESPLSNDRNS